MPTWCVFSFGAEREEIQVSSGDHAFPIFVNVCSFLIKAGVFLVISCLRWHIVELRGEAWFFLGFRVRRSQNAMSHVSPSLATGFKSCCLSLNQGACTRGTDLGTLGGLRSPAPRDWTPSCLRPGSLPPVPPPLGPTSPLGVCPRGTGRIRKTDSAPFVSLAPCF